MLREVDAVIMLSYTDLNDLFRKELRGLMEATGKPVFLIPGHPGEHGAEMSRLTRNGIPTFTIPERALKVLSAMIRYSNYRQQ